MKTLLANAFTREAAYLGGAVSITVDAILLLSDVSQQAQAAGHAICAAWVAWYVRSVSTPRVAAEERVAEARKASQDSTVAYLASLPKRAPAAKKAK